MLEQTSIRLAGAVFALLLLAVPLYSSGSAAASSAAGIMVPLYMYPGATWYEVAETKKAHSDVPIVAIVNPSNGPGFSFDPNFATGISMLKSSGVIVIGYVSTAYTNRDLGAVQADMDSWKSWYPDVAGIFFDEQTNWAGGESYYEQADNYAKSKGFTFTVGNPGTNSIPSYLDTVDVVLVYENPGLPYLGDFQSWSSADHSKLGMITFGIGSLPSQWAQEAAQTVGWIYVTDDLLPNPWDSLPFYFDDLAAQLGDDSSSIAPSVSTHTLTVRSVDQNGTEIIGMWMEIMSAGVTHSGYTPLTLSLEESFYTVSASDYQQSIFDHWSDGTNSSSISVNLSADSAVTAHYINNGTLSSLSTTLSVNTADSAGYPINGYYTTIMQNGSELGSAFSPASFALSNNQTYQVSVADYGNQVFSRWDDGSTNRTRTVSTTGPMNLTAYYESNEVLLTVTSVGLNGLPISGLWTVTESAGGTAAGFTPITHSAIPATQYTITVSDYLNYKFDHWEDGSNLRTRTITSAGDTVITAYYIP